MRKQTKAGATRIAQRQSFAKAAAVRAYLADDARHFLRLNPQAEDNPLVLAALEYMEGEACQAYEEEMEALEEAHQVELRVEALEAAEEFQELLDMVSYFLKNREDESNIGDMEAEHNRLNNYLENLKTIVRGKK